MYPVNDPVDVMPTYYIYGTWVIVGDKSTLDVVVWGAFILPDFLCFIRP